MASKSATEINLKTIQRVDSKIVEIIDTASQVAIYKYDRKLEKWEGTDVEGTLFVFRRTSYPCHGFIIVNRMNTTNFVESITSDMQFQQQDPYLLYKNHTGDIIGSWFYECKDLQRISKKIQTIVLKQSSVVPRRQRCASESESVPVVKDGGHDIMILLSEAHKQYMKSVVPPDSRPSVDIHPLAAHPEKTSRKVVDPLPPRRRFLSMGSFEQKLETTCKKSPKENGGREERDQQKKKEWPTRLSPLFSHNEIHSPISDVERLNNSFEGASPPQEVHFNYIKASFPKSNENMATKCDIHSEIMKQTLKSHIQENPKMMLKIHEAYVSSLRSIFSKD